MLHVLAKGFAKIKLVAIAIVVLVVVGVVVSSVLRSQPEPEEVVEEAVRGVQVATVRDVSLDRLPLQITGLVESVSEATVLSQSQGAVRAVYVTEGSFVTAGQLLAEMDNAIEAAQLAQAKAGVQVAAANLDKARSGARSEQLSSLQAQRDNAAVAVAEAETTAVNTLNSVFITADDAVRSKTDLLFNNPRVFLPDLIISVGEPGLEGDIEWNRWLIEERLTAWEAELTAPTGGTVGQLDAAESNLVFIRDFLSDLSIITNEARASTQLSQTTIDNWKLQVSTARSSVIGALSSVSAARIGLQQTETQLTVAENQLTEGTTGARAEDIAAAEAALAQAEAALLVAEAAFEKTVVRSPISGTVNSLSIELGDVVSPFTQVAVISNNQALQITGFITPEDRSSIQVGASVAIDGTGLGVVTRIGQAVDVTVKKVEVTVGIQDTVTALTNGQSVVLQINRRTDAAAGELTQLLVPIAALKITAQGPIVFTVAEGGVLEALSVEPGAIIGETIEILEGLTPDTKVVLDARGLSPEDEVEVN